MEVIQEEQNTFVDGVLSDGKPVLLNYGKFIYEKCIELQEKEALKSIVIAGLGIGVLNNLLAEKFHVTSIEKDLRWTALHSVLYGDAAEILYNAVGDILIVDIFDKDFVERFSADTFNRFKYTFVNSDPGSVLYKEKLQRHDGQLLDRRHIQTKVENTHFSNLVWSFRSKYHTKEGEDV